MVANLIAIILGIVFILFFAGFNLDNKCDVNLVFHTFKNVPVFFTILISFAIGMLCALPFSLVHKAKKIKKQQKKEKKNNSISDLQQNDQKADAIPETEETIIISESETGSPV